MFLRVLQERRSLLLQLVRRDFTQRFVGSAAGWLWTMVHPLVQLASWVFVFQYCFKMEPPPGAGTSYPVYLFCGYLPWLLFQETVQRASVCCTEQASLITKTVFPAEILPVSVFLSSLISHAIGMVLAMAAVAWTTGHVSVMILFLPVYTIFLGLFAIGAAWIVASLQVYLRDTSQVTMVALVAMFWLTPIFIEAEQFPENVRFLLRWNPLAHIVRAYRHRLLTYELPNLHEIMMLALATGAVFVAGGLFFRYLKRGFADVL